jgi:hypothetical protein
MEIAVYDGTLTWRGVIPQAVRNWNAAFASVGRAISLNYQEIAVADPEYRLDGGIVLTDSLPMNPSLPREAEGNYTAVEGLWYRGFVHFFRPALDSLNPTHPLAVVCHELGHNLMLAHPDVIGLTGFTDTVMTSYAVLTQPTTWDATNAMPGYPVANPPADHKKRHKRRKRKH